jgi:hypothetical protein
MLNAVHQMGNALFPPSVLPIHCSMGAAPHYGAILLPHPIPLPLTAWTMTNPIHTAAVIPVSAVPLPYFHAQMTEQRIKRRRPSFSVTGPTTDTLSNHCTLRIPCHLGAGVWAPPLTRINANL